MSIPTSGEEYSKLIEHLRLAQEDAAMLAHLANAQGTNGTLIAKGWLAVSEQLKRTQRIVTDLAVGRLQ